MTHPIPDIVLETDIAILGMKGAGKSVTAKGLVERLLAQGRRVCILDPLNHWRGLKTRADGTPGFPVVVIGGPDADIELDVHGGDLLGKVIAGSEMSFVIDVSDLSRATLISFASDFLRSIYVNNRDALWLVAEEADVFAPQNPAMDGTRTMLDMMDQIARRGRQRGFRLWSITQRPARLNKDVLSMASALVLMRIRGPQDRAAAEEWVKGHGTKDEVKLVVDGLAGLEIGQGFVYAPDVELLEKVRFPMIQTLDTSRTPKAGEARVEIKQMAQADLTALKAALAPAPPAPPAHSASASRVTASERRQIEDGGYKRGFASGRYTGLKEGLAIVQPLVAKIQAYMAECAPVAAEEDHAEPGPVSTREAFVAGPSPGNEKAALPVPRQKILDTLIWAEHALKRDALDRGQLAFLAELSATSSGFQNNLGAMKTAGLIRYPGRGTVALTPEGRQRATPPKRMKTMAVLSRLSASQRAIMREVMFIHPHAETRGYLAQHTGVSPTSSGFQNNLGALRSLGLITYPERGAVRAADVLFPFPKPVENIV